MASIVAMLQIIRGETEDRLWALDVVRGHCRRLHRLGPALRFSPTGEEVTDEVARGAGWFPEAVSMDKLALNRASGPGAPHKRRTRHSVGPGLVRRPGGDGDQSSGPGFATLRATALHRSRRRHRWDDTFEIIDAKSRWATLQTLCSRGWNGERCL